MKDEIRQLIATGKTKEALDTLAKYNSDATLLQGTFTKLERDQQLGLLDYDTYGRELNKLNYSIMSMLDSTNFSGIINTPPPHHPASRTNPYFKPSEEGGQNGKKNVFLSYAKADEALQKRLRVHLSPLRRNNHINDWSEEEILPGAEMGEAVKQRLHNADIILLLVSPDFIASDKIWETDVKIAMERHEKSEAVVVPIILKPCQWKEMPFGNLQPLPTNGLPASDWGDSEQAFFNVAEGIKKLL